MKRTVTRLAALFYGASIAVSPAVALPIGAAGSVVLTVTPITWDVVGLDSNSPATGPNRFPVGSRVCASGGTATSVTAAFVWEAGSVADYIKLRPGSLSSVDLGSIADGACADAYFEAEVTRSTAAYDTVRRYTVTATDAGSGATASSPTPRQLYVEHLISQNRNGITSIALDGTPIPAGGTMTLIEGRTYDLTLDGYTATQGYNQLESFIGLPNTIFQVLGVSTTYSANNSPYVESPNQRLYADACGWEGDPGSPNYRSCIGGDYKAGGTVSTTYTVRIVGGAGTTEQLGSLLYDFSGSSYHYNSDYSVGARTVTVVGPSSIPISKSFSPKVITPGGTSTLTIRVSNPTPNPIEGVTFTDSFPAGMKVAATPAVTYSGCGAGAFSPAPAANATSLRFEGGTIAASGVCTATVNVTAPAGTYPNTTGHLFIDTTVDTGNTASDTLTSASAAACVPGQTLASWTIPNGTTANPPDLAGGVPTTKGAGVATATAVAGVPASTRILTTSGHVDTTSWDTYGYKNAGQNVTFAIDTRKYSGITMSYWVSNPGGANGPTSLTLAYSTGGAYSSAVQTVANPATAFTQHIFDFTNLTSTSGTTSFRLAATGALNDQTGANLYFDDVAFTGCLVAAAAPVLTKSFAADPIVKGTTSTLTFTLANTAVGNEALTGVAFTDVLPAGLSVATSSTSGCGGTVTTTAASRTIAFTGGTLAAGGTCSFDVTVTGTTEGQYTNVTGFVSSTQGGTSTSYATDSLAVIAPAAIAKAFVPSAILTGGTSNLDFAITNPNPGTTLHGVSFTDTLPAGVTVATSGPTSQCGGSVTTTAPNAIELTGGVLTPGQTCRFGVSVTGTTSGTKPNTTSTVGSTEGGAGNVATATLEVTNPQPALDLTKQISLDGSTWRKFVALEPGTQVRYRFVLYNSGDVTFTSTSVVDPDIAGCTWGGAEHPPLAPGESAVCTSDWVTATSGLHTNTARASGTDGVTTTDSEPSSAAYGTTGLTIVKAAVDPWYTAAGDVLDYTFTVTNSGFAPLLGPVTVADDKATDEACPAVDSQGDFDTYLDPGESVTCTATFTVLAADVIARSVTNVATATVDGVTSPSDDTTVGLARLALVKSAAETWFDAADDVLHYSFAVTNTGAVGLAGPVTVADDKATDESCPAVTTVGDNDATLDPGERITCTATYTVLAADVTAKGVTNIATASAGGATSNEDHVEIPLAAFTIVKATTTDDITAAGQVVPFTITVTNTGAITLTGLGVTDDLCGGAPVLASGDTGDDLVFAVGEAWVYTCSHTVTQAEMNIGFWITNTATADTSETPSQSSSINVNVTQRPSLVVEKTTTTAAITHAGQVVPFTITVRNDGTVDLTAVFARDQQCDAADDPQYSSGDTANLGVLDVGETWTYTCSRTMDQVDIDIALAGTSQYRNEVRVRTHQVPETDAFVDVPVTRVSQLAIVKTSPTTGITAAGQVVPYTFTVTNTGNHALTGIVVTDPLCTAPGPVGVSGDADADLILDLTETWVYACDHTVTQAEMDAPDAQLSNTATADSTESDPATDTLTIDITQGPALTIIKTADPATIAAPGMVTYTITITNTGNVALTGVDVTDAFAGGATYESGDTDDDHVMAPDEAWVFSADYTVAQAAIDAGDDIVNTATVTTDQTGEDSDDATTTVDQSPALVVAKTSTTTSIETVGQSVSYAISVRNSGNVTLNGVVVTDPVCSAAPAMESGDTNSDSRLDVGETWIYTCSHTVTQDDLDAGGDLRNTATVTTDETGPEDATKTIPVSQQLGLSIVKTITAGANFIEVGDLIHYKYVILNTGNVTIPAPIEVADDRTSVDCPTITGLAPGASFTCTSTDKVTKADLDAGRVVNLASASGSVGEAVVESATVKATAHRAAKASTPPTSALDLLGPNGPGGGLLGVLLALTVGMLAALVAIRPLRGRRRSR